MNEIFAKLKADLGRDAVEWRAQSVTKDGTKAMALAYMNARSVMDRLDEVMGAANWSDSYVETPQKRIICTISLRIDGEWVSKSDGAGDTQVEAEKGAISDAFKRCAVKWGIGRYLYDMPTPWVPCKSYPKGDKFYFVSFEADPWKFVSGVKVEEKKEKIVAFSDIKKMITEAETLDVLKDLLTKIPSGLSEEQKEELRNVKDERKAQLMIKGA